MTTQAITANNQPQAGIALKGGMFTLTAIQLFGCDLDALSHQLDEKIKQAPKFFHYAPMILDVQLLESNTHAIDFQAICHLLKSKKLIPIGVRGAGKNLKEAAVLAGLALFPEEKSPPKRQTKSGNAQISVESGTTMPQKNQATRVITQPVRSGQQIYAPGGDLIILAPVSHGAEVLADGNIQIYAPLRGRALAGVMGNPDAMIFCKSLEAELVSVAGQYRISEDLKEKYWKQFVCIKLQDDRLNISLV
ncbi:MAG: septum site-determining protein MinC [Candidatus Berkiellales bacterium]